MRSTTVWSKIEVISLSRPLLGPVSVPWGAGFVPSGPASSCGVPSLDSGCNGSRPSSSSFIPHPSFSHPSIRRPQPQHRRPSAVACRGADSRLRGPPHGHGPPLQKWDDRRGLITFSAMFYRGRHNAIPPQDVAVEWKTPQKPGVSALGRIPHLPCEWLRPVPFPRTPLFPGRAIPCHPPSSAPAVPASSFPALRGIRAS